MGKDGAGGRKTKRIVRMPATKLAHLRKRMGRVSSKAAGRGRKKK